MVDTNALAQLSQTGAARHLANPLGIGGSKTTDFLVDPLGLFSKKDKKPFVYEEGKVYGNPKKAEMARQITIQRGTQGVNDVFDAPERQAQYEQFLQGLRDFYSADANKQKGIADRNLKFTMARSGLTGGSASVDANRSLGEEYTKGLLDAENRAQSAYAGLKGQDEQSRLSLLSMVRSGMDTTTAAQRAGAALQVNAKNAETDSFANGLGDIFGSMAESYKTQREAAERRRGVRDAYGSFYGPKSPYA
jgi:hypothetical protein